MIALNHEIFQIDCFNEQIQCNWVLLLQVIQAYNYKLLQTLKLFNIFSTYFCSHAKTNHIKCSDILHELRDYQVPVFIYNLMSLVK